MTSVWHDAGAKRPNPYLDWEARTRNGLQEQSPSGPRWCSLYIRMKSEPDYFSNLTELLRLAKNKANQLWMSADERANLKRIIESGKLQPNVDKVLVSFFVYRPESEIYLESGDFKPNDLFDVILAGPPIPPLSFDPDDAGPPETGFNPPGELNERGVAIGIIDDAIAFANARFCAAGDKTRVAAIWLQEIERRVGGKDFGVASGHRLTGAEIDKLKDNKSEDAFYRSIGLTDFAANKRNPLASRATHGTHVLDLAAGYDPQTETANLRPILAVQLPQAAPVDRSGITLGSNVLQAVRQIMLWADRMEKDVNGNPITGPSGEVLHIPLVINFSYGISAGPKDGTQEVEKALNELVAFRNKNGASTCLVVPAGNNYRTRTTANMKLARGESRSIDWIILPDDSTPNFLEIWFDGRRAKDAPCPIELMLTPAGGLPADTSIPRKGAVRELTVDDKAVAATYYTVSDETKRGRIFIAINQTASLEGRTDCASAGRWRLTLKNVSDQRVSAHLYIQRDDTPFGRPRAGRQSYFDDEAAFGRDPETGAYDLLDKGCPITHRDTLSAIATSPDILVVGAADASKPFIPALYTSSGPVKKRRSPDCSAVTEDGRMHWGVLAAGTFSGSMVRMNGTSAAAPQLVRAIAHIFSVRDGREGGVPADILGSLPQPPESSQGSRLPQEARPNEPDQSGFTVSTNKKARLGNFVLQRSPNRRRPRRRYSAGETEIARVLTDVD